MFSFHFTLFWFWKLSFYRKNIWNKKILNKNNCFVHDQGLDSSEPGSDKGELIKSLNIRNAEALEARVRKELEEQGILDPNEEDGPAGEAAKENDEIFEELLRCQVNTFLITHVVKLFVVNKKTWIKKGKTCFNNLYLLKIFLN